MPEGHKTHYLAKQHTESMGGQSLRITSPQGRFRGDARKVTRRELVEVTAAGKHLFYHFDNDWIVHVHLGRYGKFRQHPSPPPAPVGQVRMRMSGPELTLDLTGPSTCRVIAPDQRNEVIAKLGPDPLAGGSKRDVWNAINNDSKPIGAVLLDQSVVAGVGNIFRAEVLFEAEIDPETRGCDLSRESFDRLWRSLLRMMQVGLKLGKIVSTTAREAGTPVAKLEGKDRFRVYGRTHCPRCGGDIEVSELASRKLYWCPGCQTSV